MTKLAKKPSKSGIGRSASVGMKIGLVVAFCLAMLITVSGVSLWQMNAIGTEIEGIAERDIPMTTALTNITVHQLEQAVNFERAIGAAQRMRQDTHAAEVFKKSVETFEALTTKVDKEIKDAEKLAEKAAHDAATAEARQEFKHVLEALKKIEKGHKGYDDHAIEIFRLMAAGRQNETAQMIEKTEAEEEKLDHALEKLLAEIGAFTGKAASTAEAHEHFAIKLLLGISAIALLVCAVFAWLIIRRSIATPLREVIGALDALTAGNTDVDIAARSDDEIGTVAKALAIFRDKMVENQRLEAEQAKAEERQREEEATREREKREAEAKAASEAEEKRRVDDERNRVMAEMSDAFVTDITGVIQSVASAADEMQSSAQAMSATAEQTSQQSNAVAAASEEASANVQTVASAAEELSASVQEISRQVSQSTTIANNAVEEAQKTNERIQALAEASQKIGDVVSLINDIASQTNLLALNATIEAARAGEAGKGFAVVATEVKSLADQTAKATEEIANQITEIQGSTTDAVEAIQGIGNIIAEINDIASAISTAVDQQGGATQEIAQNVSQAAAGTQEVSSNIGGVTQAASETGSAAGQVLSAAGELAEQGNVLRRTVDEFVERLRAA